jgi:hypothetical protein
MGLVKGKKEGGHQWSSVAGMKINPGMFVDHPYSSWLLEAG